jgi:hypothetical protein
VKVSLYKSINKRQHNFFWNSTYTHDYFIIKPYVYIVIFFLQDTLMSCNAIVAEGLKKVEAKFPRIAVAAQLQQEARERRRKTHRLSQMQVDRMGYFITKYGNDYRVCIFLY